MQEAGPVTFMRTILILIIIYYVFKLIARYVLPFFLKRFIHKMQDKAQQQYGNQQQETNVNVGETSIDKKPNQQGQSNNSAGEYVDYEEVD